MAWTSPPTFVSGQVVTATDMNNLVRDNETYLLSGRPKIVTLRDNNASYTTTSTSFVDVDSTNLALTITLNSTCLLIGFSASVTADLAGRVISFDIDIDGTLVGSAGANGMVLNNYQNNPLPVAFTVLKTGLSVGSHTVKIKWKVSAGTATMYAGNGVGNQDSLVSLWAVEVG